MNILFKVYPSKILEEIHFSKDVQYSSNRFVIKSTFIEYLLYSNTQRNGFKR